MTSLDGITWTARSAGAGDDDNWESVAYGNGLFVAAGFNSGSDTIITSPDGITWTTQTTPNVTNARWNSMVYA